MGFLLCASGSSTSLHPCDLLAQDILMFVLSGKCDVLTLCLQHEIAFVVGIVAVGFAFVDLYYAVAHLVKKVSVVGDHDQSALVVVKVILQIFCHIVVEVVGGLVQNKNVTS